MQSAKEQAVWVDHFTGRQFLLGEEYIAGVKGFLAARLAKKITDSLAKGGGPGGEGGFPAPGAGTTGSASLEAARAAGAAARFWARDYYSLIFPLSWGLVVEPWEVEGTFSLPAGGGYNRTAEREAAGQGHRWAGQGQGDGFPAAPAGTQQGGWFRAGEPVPEVHWPDVPAAGWRECFLQGGASPPVLPAFHGRKEELVADHLVAFAGPARVLLKEMEYEGLDPGLVQEVRLGIFWHHLADQLAGDAPLAALAGRFPLAAAVARWLDGGGAAPEGVPGEVLAMLQELHEGRGETPLYLVIGAVQRIKKYVFAAPGLNEVRGASALLDKATDKIARVLEECLGPEVILRQAGSAVVFLAPADGLQWLAADLHRIWTKIDTGGRAGECGCGPLLLPDDFAGAGGPGREDDGDGGALFWEGWVRQCFRRSAGNLLVAAAAVKTSASMMHGGYGAVSTAAWNRLARDRLKGDGPLLLTLPFEERCAYCRQQPAGLLIQEPEGEKKPACPDCARKRRRGREERQENIRRLLDGSQINTPAVLVGRAGGKISPPAELSKLNPAVKSRSNLLAHIYGDGNNFGRVVQQLSSLPLALQWTQRVKEGVRGALLASLGRAAREAAAGWRDFKGYEHLPFQLLVFGGDDLSLITAGRMGLGVAAYFVQLTDWEFAPVPGKVAPENVPSFSVGVLLADDKTPVRVAMEYCEGQLLKGAKRKMREKKGAGGLVHFLVADSLDALPADVDAYFNRYLLKKGRDGVLSLSLRPLAAAELLAFLDLGRRVLPHKGVYRRLAEAYLKNHILSAMLFYVYQQSRMKGSAGDGENIYGLLSEAMEFPGMNGRVSLFPAVEDRQRYLPGGGNLKNGYRYFAPVWDLLEIVKTLE